MSKWWAVIGGMNIIFALVQNLGTLGLWWNHMSQEASYFPKPVKVVAIPKKNGGIRTFGVSSVEDRVAQIVTKLYFESTVGKLFYDDF